VTRAVCRYEELEAISVSEKLSQLDTSETKEQSLDGENKTDNVTSADSQTVSPRGSDEKNENKFLGIC